MNSSWLKIFELVLGTAEAIVPVFIHNPRSQQIEGVIVTTLNGVLAGLDANAKPAATPTTTSAAS